MKQTTPCESPGLAAQMPREQWLNHYLEDTSVSVTEGCEDHQSKCDVLGE